MTKPKVERGLAIMMSVGIFMSCILFLLVVIAFYYKNYFIGIYLSILCGSVLIDVLPIPKKKGVRRGK